MYFVGNNVTTTSTTSELYIVNYARSSSPWFKLMQNIWRKYVVRSIFVSSFFQKHIVV